MRPVKNLIQYATAGFVLALTGIGVWRASLGEWQPTYQGRLVSYWFRQYYRSGAVASDGNVWPRDQQDIRKGSEAGHALGALGTNALPYLLKVCFSTNQDTYFQIYFHALLSR